MQHLLYWMRKQEISDEMLWKQSAIDQEIFIRDTIGGLLKTNTFVVSEHTSKSIILPVYAFTMRNGISIIARENFYGWKLSVELPDDRPYADIIPKDLISDGYKETIHPCYFEGFETKWCYEGYNPEDIKQRKFSIGIYSNYKFFTVMYMLSHLFEPIDFSDMVSSDIWTAGRIKATLDDIYKSFGCNEKRADNENRTVMKGSDLLWDTYSMLIDNDFLKKNGLVYTDMFQIYDDTEKFADTIFKHPKVGKEFYFAVFCYQKKYD